LFVADSLVVHSFADNRMDDKTVNHKTTQLATFELLNTAMMNIISCDMLQNKPDCVSSPKKIERNILLAAINRQIGQPASTNAPVRTKKYLYIYGMNCKTQP